MFSLKAFLFPTYYYLGRGCWIRGFVNTSITLSVILGAFYYGAKFAGEEPLVLLPMMLFDNYKLDPSTKSNLLMFALAAAAPIIIFRNLFIGLFVERTLVYKDYFDAGLGFKRTIFMSFIFAIILVVVYLVFYTNFLI